MNQRVNISAFKYAIISNTEIVSLSNDIHAAHRVAYSSWHVVETKELEAFKVLGYVARDHAARGYIGYATVDQSTVINSLYL